MYSHKECGIKPINGKIRQGIYTLAVGLTNSSDETE